MRSVRPVLVALVFSFAAPALGSDVVIPPMPDSWKARGDKWSWERAVRVTPTAQHNVGSEALVGTTCGLGACRRNRGRRRWRGRQLPRSTSW
jgi:hypothetical protein